MSNRVTFLVDGFNLYYSVRDAIHDHKLNGGRWLNIRELLSSFISVFGKDAVLHEIYYFSALATHVKDPGSPLRHELFIRALKSTGVKVVLGNFKRKKIRCRADCGKEGWGNEEKETDVNIAVTMIEVLMKESCDTVVLVSGDTDLASTLRTAKRLFPTAKLGVGLPYRRGTKELAQLADFKFKITAEHYERHVFTDAITLPDGSKITKPPKW